jgi:hypothetical protein
MYDHPNKYALFALEDFTIKGKWVPVHEIDGVCEVKEFREKNIFLPQSHFVLANTEGLVTFRHPDSVERMLAERSMPLNSHIIIYTNTTLGTRYRLSLFNTHLSFKWYSFGRTHVMDKQAFDTLINHNMLFPDTP